MLTGLIRQRVWPMGLRSMRMFSADVEVKVAVDKASLSKLRKKTGYPILHCKKALEQFNNDVKQAEAWMREEAQKAGWDKAGKLQDRPMSQGLLGIIDDESSVTVVEVNCETDFVAKNEKFQSLVCQLAEACHKNMLTRGDNKVVLEKTEVNALQDDGKTLADYVALQIGLLGENMALRRAAFVKNEPGTVMSTFVHAAGPQMSKDRCKMGKFVSIVKLEIPDVDGIAKEVCQHIVGMNPKQIGEWQPPVVDKKEMKKKKKKMDGDTEPDLKKTEPVEESPLLDQEFLLIPNLSVRKYLQNNGPQVIDFVRLECGEDLGEDD